MKAVWTSKTNKKSIYKLTGIKLNCEPGEYVIISSLSGLKTNNFESIIDFSAHEFTERVGEFGDCHLLTRISDENSFFLFDNDQDGIPPNIQKIVKKSNKKSIGFFVNSSNVNTSDFLDGFMRYNNYQGVEYSTKKKFKILNNDLIFFCIPERENRFCKTKFSKKEITKFSQNIDLFIKNRIEKKKLIKLKVLNGEYAIISGRNVNWGMTYLAEFEEPMKLLGHFIKKV